ncbi:YciI family protein [Variovorax sp. PAMC26660]|uniref:YciI family protein n=1 Tax=Variovorax sp. PAMC26660 TaxID=2762322 RepID=UPI00164E2C87|nr:YciI family protein [Variovorax sp. PAMC26660]QNK66314.1 YciI family protein [Variovorax sp. PAMC26660]
MKYLCLVFCDEAVIRALPPDELKALNEQSMAYDRELEKSGHFITAEALGSVKSAKVVQVRNGKRSHVDGPYAEAREQLGGFILIDARDLNAAIQIAGHIPMARYGAIEVRPIEIIGKTEGNAA